MINEDKYRKLKRTLRKLEQQKQQAQGALDQSNRQLKDEFKLNSIRQAKRKLKRLKREVASDEKEFEEKLEAFKKKYRKLFSPDQDED